MIKRTPLTQLSSFEGYESGVDTIHQDFLLWANQKMDKKSNYVDCAKFETFSATKQKNEDVIFVGEQWKFEIFVKDFDRKVQEIPTNFNSIYDFFFFFPISSIVLTGKLNIPILKFLLILYPVCWNLVKNILIWRRPFLPCVKSSSLNFYFYTVWAEMTLFFRSKHWK